MLEARQSIASVDMKDVREDKSRTEMSTRKVVVDQIGTLYHRDSPGKEGRLSVGDRFIAQLYG